MYTPKCTLYTDKYTWKDINGPIYMYVAICRVCFLRDGAKRVQSQRRIRISAAHDTHRRSRYTIHRFADDETGRRAPLYEQRRANSTVRRSAGCSNAYKCLS